MLYRAREARLRRILVASRKAFALNSGEARKSPLSTLTTRFPSITTRTPSTVNLHGLNMFMLALDVGHWETFKMR